MTTTSVFTRVGNECSVCTTRHSNWKQEILAQVTPHAVPCWTHSDTSKWDSDPWEIAKVFTSYGEGELMAGEGDTFALVQLVLNCQLFSGCISSRQSFEEASSALFLFSNVMCNLVIPYICRYAIALTSNMLNNYYGI